MHSLFVKFLCFSIVGLSGVVIDFGITYLCKEHLKWQKYWANACGFLVAASSNYFLNRVWTFHSQNPEIAKEYSSFLLVSFIGLLINSLFLWLIHQRLNLSFYYAKFIAIIITTLWNFFCNLLFTFQ